MRNEKETLMWGGEDPINPACSIQEAQYLLDIAYPESDNKAFTIRILKDEEGRIIRKQLIKFHHAGNKMWNGYVVTKNFQKVISDKTFKIFKEYGLIISSKDNELK